MSLYLWCIVDCLGCNPNGIVMIKQHSHSFTLIVCQTLSNVATKLDDKLHCNVSYSVASNNVQHSLPTLTLIVPTLHIVCT